MRRRKHVNNGVFIKPNNTKYVAKRMIIAGLYIFAIVAVCFKVFPSIAEKAEAEHLTAVLNDTMPGLSSAAGSDVLDFYNSTTSAYGPEAVETPRPEQFAETVLGSSYAEMSEDEKHEARKNIGGAYQDIQLPEAWSVEREEDFGEQVTDREPPPDATKITESTFLTSRDSTSQAEGVYINNNTTYNINPSKILNSVLGFSLAGGPPQVLIVHTHSSESYTPAGVDYYSPSDPYRTEDTRYNIVRVGDEMTEILTDMGVGVIHDRTINDYPSYNGSYTRMLQRIENYLAEYPTIKIVIDVHRDAVVTEDEVYKLCAEIDGEKVSQVMIICGTNQAGLPNDNWSENLTFAMKYQREMNRLFPGLARPINLAKERYNMHLTNGSLILEVGTNANTLEEAVKGARMAATALGSLISRIK